MSPQVISRRIGLAAVWVIAAKQFSLHVFLCRHDSSYLFGHFTGSLTSKLMARPTHVDSQRIISLTEETCERLRVLSWLSEENLHSVAQSKSDLEASGFNHEFLDAFMAHYSLLLSFQQTNVSEEGTIMDVDHPDLSEEGRETAQRLQRSTMDLTRLLLKNREAFGVLKTRISPTGSPAVLGFVDAIQDLRKLFLSKLTTPIEEEMSREKELEAIQEKLAKAKEEEARSERELFKMREERNKARENRTATVGNLKAVLGEVKGKTEQRIKQIDKEYEQKHNQNSNAYMDRLKRLGDTMQQLEKEIDELQKQNQDDEESIRGKIKRLETRARNPITTYDTEMTEKTDTFGRLRDKATEEQNRLSQLEENYRQIQAERARLIEMERRETQRREMELKRLMQRNMAAEYIQAHWKGHSERLEFEKMKKKFRMGRRMGKMMM